MQDPDSLRGLETVEDHQWNNMAEALGWFGTEEELLKHLESLAAQSGVSD